MLLGLVSLLHHLEFCDWLGSWITRRKAILTSSHHSQCFILYRFNHCCCDKYGNEFHTIRFGMANAFLPANGAIPDAALTGSVSSLRAVIDARDLTFIVFSPNVPVPLSVRIAERGLLIFCASATRKATSTASLPTQTWLKLRSRTN